MYICVPLSSNRFEQTCRKLDKNWVYRYSGRISMEAYSNAVLFKPERWHSITVEMRIGVTCAGNLLMCRATRMSIRALDLSHDPQIHIILPDVKLSAYSFHNLSSIEMSSIRLGWLCITEILCSFVKLNAFYLVSPYRWSPRRMSVLTRM
jgi:hypothetical protein